MNNSDCLSILVVYPEKKKIKPRLTRDMDPELVSEFFYRFVPEFISRYRYGLYDFNLCIFPEHYRENFIKWLGNDYEMTPQNGKKMNEKIKNCFEGLFNKGYERVILLTSDTPEMPYLSVEKAFDLLIENDVVIGPSNDGSFYLLGMNKNIYDQGIFDDIPNGTGIEFLTIYNRVKQHKVALLPKCNNIDVIEDIQLLLTEKKNVFFGKSPTMEFLEEHRELICSINTVGD